MLYKTIIEALKVFLRGALPKEKAWDIMSPEGRELYPKHKNTPRKSAVLIALYKKDGEYCFPILRRTKYNGPHSGQMGLPGGKVEPDDESIIYTALREAYEEIGIIPSHVHVIGELSELYIPVTNILVTPVVGYIDYEPQYIINKKEVDELFLIPVSYLFDKERKKSEVWDMSGNKVNIPFYDFYNQTVWGATAMILSELEMVLRPIQ